MNIFIARQPIFDRNLNVFGYELLYRSDFENISKIFNGDVATSMVLNNGILMLNDGKSEKYSFINFTKKLIIDEVPLLFSNEDIVVEILENIIPDEEFISKCIKMKKRGYILALDDFVLSYEYEDLIKLSDIIKVDFLLNSRSERKEIIKKYSNYNVKFLAEKIETNKEFEEAKSDGYSFFQGYFFEKPSVISGKDIDIIPTNLFKLIDMVYSKDVNYNDIAKVIKNDVALTYKLLRLTNSVNFGKSQEISSINHALTFLGIKELRKWLSIIMVNNIDNKKTDELIKISLIRGRMTELLAEKLNLASENNDFFLVGLLSLIDTLTNTTMEEALRYLPINLIIKETLLGKDTIIKKVLNIVLMYEKNDWNNLEFFCKSVKINFEELTKIYYKSIKWADNVIMEY
ncbi:HDOD domain-containing protein [Oceanotoga sp. DSM 15011]|uniref:Diguanylate phosphodiesterase n=1 Tax=Oceanotoga teriensis TaxID=515440 RepID=A0AA45HIM7_9BACT|nr:MULTISPECIES: HDOD domain-containing protein [Oceanotoga]PWJ92094.1 diguanylate phosphodiesterase [Oceanotoga teriensis]UYO98956.1 HDOD domain-containing protein [Oceanotoga sp. DSM 15011]